MNIGNAGDARLKKLKTTPFILEGSISSALTDDELQAALAEAREDAAKRASTKMLESLASDFSTSPSTDTP